MRHTTSVAVFGPQGRILLLRRSPTDRWKPGHWNLPGGRVDPGESIPAGAQRELAEEAGFVVPLESLSWRMNLSFTPTLKGHVFRVCLPERPQVTMPDGEHDAYQWVFVDQLPHPCIPNLSRIVRLLS
jgi:8-oxo-dGTP diphosphatase